MAEYNLDIPDFLQRSTTWPVIDVRSPAEYARGHIPGASNLPLFTNEERSMVGTLYLQKGSTEAIMKGLELVGPKLKEFALEAIHIAPGGEILIYCWRGGMRSNSMAWLLNLAGIRSHTLDGGYKSYRRFIHDYFTRPFNLVVIGGMTGSGKTEVLEEIKKAGMEIIHLEQLACHKGSVFGHLGMPDQPANEQFENEIFTRLYALDSWEPVFVEDESLSIGRVFIPKPFFSQMSSAPFINLSVPLHNRIMRLVSSYTDGDRNILEEGVKRIEKRLGTENTSLVTGLIREGNMEKAVEIVLRYYDKVYQRSMGLHQRKEILEITINNEKPDEIARRIIAEIRKKEKGKSKK
jgi:tRNA 2-selenouridine synthase